MKMLVQLCGTFVHLLVFLTVGPVALLILILSYLYMNICKIVLKLIYKEKFVDIMAGTDTVWQLDDYNARSIVNLVLEVKSDKCDPNGYDSTILEDVRKEFAQKIFSDVNLEKMTYERRNRLGYCFWLKRENFAIEDHIRRVVVPSRLNKKSLIDYVSKTSSSFLPLSNSSTWEVLVCEQSLSDTQEDEAFQTLAVIFRFHHSLGDGLAVLKLLLHTILQEKDYTSSTVRKAVQSRSLIDWFNLIIQIPSTALKQVLRRRDVNVLHGPELDGAKNVVWQFDDDDLLIKVMKIKKSAPGTTFTDIILSAFSVSIHKYFRQYEKIRCKPKDYLSGCLAARGDSGDIKYSSENVELGNKLTLAIQTIPLLKGNLHYTEQIKQIQKTSNKRQYQFDSQINYWILQVVARVFPEQILRLLFPIRQATVAMSNIPGFSYSEFTGGRKLNNIIFSVPNRGNSGIGLSILTYNNKLELGFIADKALIKSPEECMTMLVEMKNEINRMYKQL